MTASTNLHGPLRRELLSVLVYVNRGAAKSKRAATNNGFAEPHFDSLITASRMQ